MQTTTATRFRFLSGPTTYRKAGDDVIIDGTKYTVNTVAAGTAPAHSADSLTAETNTTISLYDYGTTNAADLSGVDLSGLVISELYLFEVSVTATAINGNDGESYFTVTADTDTDLRCHHPHQRYQHHFCDGRPDHYQAGAKRLSSQSFREQ